MSVARHHAEWLSLVECSGPFISLPVLQRVFPQGLDPRDPERASRLREAYEDWLDRGETQAAVHQAWIRHVLTDFLGYPENLLAEGQAIPAGMEASLPTFGITLRPDFALKHREADQKPVLLVAIYPQNQDLDKPVGGSHWKASPSTRMAELLHGADVPTGLVTNGEQWMVVNAVRGETTGFASWYADLWMQEPITLRAFQSLVHLRRFLGVAEEETLSVLYSASRNDQQEVTDQLGYQVRRAVEMLVQEFDRLDAESGRRLLAQIPEKEVYDSALTVMMRLVFLFSAEERGLLLLGDPLYDQHYAVSTLSALLREAADQHGEEMLERRHDAWCRLLATFRAVHGGIEHETIRLPAYGGTLFDPDRYAFLEGRPAGSHWRAAESKPPFINNRVVLHLLEALQMLRVKLPGGGPAEARRISFRALDIEQIGHVYEGLLDHTARRASEHILGLAGTRDSEPEIPLSRLEEMAAKGEESLLEFLEEETSRTKNSLQRALQAAQPGEEEQPAKTRGRKASAVSTISEHELLIAAGQDAEVVSRIQPYAGLIRRDDFGRAIVIHPGSIFVTRGSDRRSTGTHYTPRSLTEPIVQHTLEPLVYIGPAEGLPKAEWKLRTAREILALKVCDMAMGSGAFLVQTCRYLAERLVEAWENAEKENPGKLLATPEGDFSEGNPTERLIPTDPAERLAIARRYVADRCLYGVDINPMAVEMAKLSLWLVTLQKDRPFNFLDHALKCGDSLLGVSSLEQVEIFSLRKGHHHVVPAIKEIMGLVQDSAKIRLELENLPSNDHTQIETKNRLHAEAEAATANVKALADSLIALELRGLDGDAYADARETEADQVQRLMKQDADTSNSELLAHANDWLHGRRLFHWPVEFPEVFARGGFDGFVGNPPFMGGAKLETQFGTDWRGFLVRFIANGVTGVRGGADLCTYFLLQCRKLLKSAGGVGIIATNSIAQGDSQTVGLEQLINDGCVIARANPDEPWPGAATVHYAALWIRSGDWSGERVLNERAVPFISAMLSEAAEAREKPRSLVANSGQAFEGSKVLGIGFVISPEEVNRLISSDKRNNEVLYPYLTGEDLNSQPNLFPTRWAINFKDWELAEAERYPECLRIVRERVKPGRDAMVGRNQMSTKRGTAWWRFAGEAKNLHAAIDGKSRCLVLSRITNHLSFAFVPTNWVYSDRLTVFSFSDIGSWTVLQSSFHYIWAWHYSTTNLSLLSYSPSQAFLTFPFPKCEDCLMEIAREVGQRCYAERSALMEHSQQGLTSVYNRFHDRSEQSEDIARLRALHEEMDQAVAAAYGWSDLDLGHGFHATKQGERYTLSEPARRTVLDRLLALNHQRYEEEVKAGLHEKKKPKSKKPKKPIEIEGQQELFG